MLCTSSFSSSSKRSTGSGRAQHWVAELAHVTQRRVAALAGLRIELRGRILLALYLDIPLLGGGTGDLRRGFLLGCAVLGGHRPSSL